MSASIIPCGSPFAFRVSRFAFRVSRFAFRVSRFAFRVSRFAFCVLRFAFRVSVRLRERLCLRAFRVSRFAFAFRVSRFDVVRSHNYFNLASLAVSSRGVKPGAPPPRRPS